MMKRVVFFFLTVSMTLFLTGCHKLPINPNIPYAYINFTIYPNSIEHRDINNVSGWEYVTSDPTSGSRGIIIYRYSETEFRAYDRIPPNEPNACTDSLGNTTRLVVDFPFVIDHCNNAYYEIAYGNLVTFEPDGMPDFPLDVVYPLIQYRTIYDGQKLTVKNF